MRHVINKVEAALTHIKGFRSDRTFNMPYLLDAAQSQLELSLGDLQGWEIAFRAVASEFYDDPNQQAVIEAFIKALEDRNLVSKRKERG